MVQVSSGNPDMLGEKQLRMDLSFARPGSELHLLAEGQLGTGLGQLLTESSFRLVRESLPISASLHFWTRS